MWISSWFPRHTLSPNLFLYRNSKSIVEKKITQIVFKFVSYLSLCLTFHMNLIRVSSLLSPNFVAFADRCWVFLVHFSRTFLWHPPAPESLSHISQTLLITVNLEDGVFGLILALTLSLWCPLFLPAVFDARTVGEYYFVWPQ